MRIYEVIEKVYINSNKSFVIKSSKNMNFVGTVLKNERGYLRLLDRNGDYLSDYDVKRVFTSSLESEWEEVLQPVTWQEALEAELDGKKTYCIYNGYKQHVGDVYADGVILIEWIKNGTWYMKN